jgi:hypothetical protein
VQPEEILAAAEAGGLPEVEDVDPLTARLEDQYLVVSGRVAMPLDGVAWSLDRSDDILIRDDLGAPLGVLCLVAGRGPKLPAEMTRYQYTALLADAPDAKALLGPARISRDYVIIYEAELARYLEHYRDGSALWGGFHHGEAPAYPTGGVTEIKARRGIVVPTPHHLKSLLLLTRSTNPREQFLRTYHLIELLFDYVTYRRFVKAGNDLAGFGKIMSAYQRSELERLKSIIKDFCRDLDAVAAHMASLEPFLARAEEMFQTLGKDGNPLKEDKRWTAFRSLVEAGTVDRPQAATSGLAKGAAQFDETISGLAAYQIYRLRSSIAHSRIGEYLLTDEDDAMISDFGLPLLGEVAGQVFSSTSLAELVA